MRNEYLQLPIMDFAIPTFPIVLLGCANTTAVLQTGVVAGICFHFLVAAPTVEFERYMRRFIAAAGLFSGGDLTVSLFFTGRSTTAALAHLIMPWSGFVVGLLLSLTIYRLFFHRCQISWPSGSKVDTLLRILPQCAWGTIQRKAQSYSYRIWRLREDW
jgi:hypothetical protein